MTNIKVTLNNTEDLVCKLRHASENDAFCEPLGLLADYLEDQLPKPVPAEPTGDVAVFRSGWFYKPGGNKGWVRDDLVPFGWDEIVHGSPEDLAIYRRDDHSPLLQQVRDLLFRSPSGTLSLEEIGTAYKAIRKGLSGILSDPQSDGAGALPTSPSPEVGVATSPPASSPEEPTEFGSLIRALWSGENLLWVKAAHNSWWSESGVATAWSELHDVQVLRIGVGTDEKAKADEAVAYSNGYEKGAADKVARILLRLRALRAVAITAPEQDQLDKAIRECR